MSCEHFGNVSAKNILMQYFKLNNKDDIADLVEQYVDEECGVVLNKHPATNEDKFSNIYDFKASAAAPQSVSPVASSTSSEFLVESTKVLCNDLNKSTSHCLGNLNISNGLQFDHKEKASLKNDTKETVYRIHSKEDDVDGTFNTAQIRKDQETLRTITGESLNHLYNIIAPEGRGILQKFIGDDFVYVILEDGTHNCYPINLVKYNRAYLKKNPLLTLNYNYKDVALQHTQNILKGKKSVPLCKTEGIEATETKPSYEFIDFPEDLSYLKEYLKCSDQDEDKNHTYHSVHLKTKQKTTGYNDSQIAYVEDSNYLQNKENIFVSNLKNMYQIEKIKSYKVLDEEIVEEGSTNHMCCEL